MSLRTTALTLHAFWRAWQRRNRAKTRARLLRTQQRLLKQFLSGAAADVPAFAALRGEPLSAWPIMDKATLMSRYADYNRLGLTADEAWAHLNAGTAPEGYTVGASTGTSGNRGLYVVSEAERCRWLGVMLAWALPDVFSSRHRVAVVLPINTRLYDTANESGRLALQFFDLSKGIEAQFGPLSAFRPTVIVAPPKFLTALARADLDLRPARMFSSAEVLDNRDRQVIERRFGLTLGEIYMATEGLFGVSCPHGTLHLIEDHVAFEFEPVDGSHTLVTPIVTDFSRTTQIMVRYRMNDILELHDQPCPCGLPHTAVKQVHGRCDDVFRFPDGAGNLVSITPDVIRNAIVTADPGIADFRVIQTGPNSVQLELQACPAETLRVAAQNLELLFDGCGAHPGIDGKCTELLSPTDRKLRRVMVLPGAQNA